MPRGAKSQELLLKPTLGPRRRLLLLDDKDVWNCVIRKLGGMISQFVEHTFEIGG